MKVRKTLHLKKAEPDKGAIALLAWEILGTLFLVGVVFSVIAMIPEMSRYLKLKSM